MDWTCLQVYKSFPKYPLYDIKCLHCRSTQGVHVTCNMSYGATVRASAANSNFLYLFLYYYTKLYYIFIYSLMLVFFNDSTCFFTPVLNKFIRTPRFSMAREGIGKLLNIRDTCRSYFIFKLNDHSRHHTTHMYLCNVNSFSIFWLH